MVGGSRRPGESILQKCYLYMYYTHSKSNKIRITPTSTHPLPNYSMHDPDPQFPQRVPPSVDQVGAHRFVSRTPCPCVHLYRCGWLRLHRALFREGIRLVLGWGEEDGHEGSAVRGASRSGRECDRQQGERVHEPPKAAGAYPCFAPRYRPGCR